MSSPSRNNDFALGAWNSVYEAKVLKCFIYTKRGLIRETITRSSSMRRGIVFIFVVVYIVSFNSQVYSQNIGDGLDTERFKPSLDSQGLIVTEAGRGEDKGNLNLGLYLHYAKKPLVLSSGDTIIRELISDRLAGNVRFSTGVTNWLTLGVDIPAVFYQDGSLLDQDTGESVKLAGAVLGDIRFVPKLTILRALSGFSLGLMVPVTLPSGDEESFYGNKGLTAGPTLAASVKLLDNRLLLAANLGALLQENSGYADLEVGHEAFYRVGAGVIFTEKWMLSGELMGGGRTANLFENPPKETPMEAVLGLRVFAPHDLIFTAGGATGILKGWGTPNYRIFMGLMWSPRDHDKDNDGISDLDDGCPTEPGPKENLGCPWQDKDSDGLLDNEDQCPSKMGPVENRGCPWGDADEDGTTDNLDKCPQKPGPKDNQGCPWGDADKDTITDNLDQCPDEPEDKDGFEDEDGCPDPDNDQDGLADTNDKCPNEAEVINGYQDEDGCPDEGKVVVFVKDEKIEILQKVHFATGKADILPDSFGLLDQVAQILKVNPKIKIIQIEGHTDSLGADKLNQQLSEKRAESVKAYLVNRGTQPERLQTKGFGESQPIDSNKTPTGRENNRRVEFTIIEKE